MGFFRPFTPLLILMLLGGGLVGWLPTMAQAQVAAGKPMMTVTGIGHATAQPDQAEIQVGVLTESVTAREALDSNTTAMQALFKTLAAFQIADRDIQTTSFTVSPVYARRDREHDLPRIAAYRVENRVSLNLRGLAQVGKLLDTLVTQGANTVHSIQFTVADPQPLLDAARQQAVQDARRKADLYAKAAGVAIGRVLSMQEEGTGVPSPRPMFARTMAAESSVPVAPGESTFSARVTMIYELIDQ